MHYFEIYIYISESHNYFIFFKMEGEKIEEKDIIEHALLAKLFIDDGDEKYVKYIKEISEEDYEFVLLGS